MEWLKPLSSQWQLALLLLCSLMATLVWRAHRQVSRLEQTSKAMHDELLMLVRSVDGINGRTTNTEHTLVANLSEYRMAMGNTSQYREYLQKLGVAPASDVEPILEAIPDGAFAVGKGGRVLYVNRSLYDATGIEQGITVEEMAKRFEFRSIDGDTLAPEELPEKKVLSGEEFRGFLLRMRPEGTFQDLILQVNGCPVRDIFGRVVAAVMVARPVSEEVALAIQVREMTEGQLGLQRVGVAPPPTVAAGSRRSASEPIVTPERAARYAPIS